MHELIERDASLLLEYSDEQDRDDHGRWTAAGGAKWVDKVDPKFVDESKKTGIAGLERDQNGLVSIFDKTTITYQDVPVSSLETMTKKGEVHPKSQNKWDKAIKSGKAMPAVVGHQKPDGSYYVLDGNHRVHAAQDAGLKTVRMAVLTPKPGYTFGKGAWFGKKL